MWWENSERVVDFLEQFGRSLTEGTSLHDKQGKFIEANPRLCEILGYSREELLGFDIFHVLDPSSLKREQGSVDDLINTRHEVEVIALGKVGKKRHFLISVFPITGKEGSTQGCLNVWNDITLKVERERNAQILKELEDIVAWISVQFINMPWPLIDQGITWLLGDLGTFLRVDHAFVFRFGRTEADPAEPVNSWCKDRPVTQELTKAAPPPWILKKVKAKERVVIPTLGDGVDGKGDGAEWMETAGPGINSLACVPIAFQDEVIGMLWLDASTVSFTWDEGILGQLQLVSILIANALDRKKTGELLLASEEKYKKLAENAQDFIVVYNTSYQIIYANKAAIQTSGYTEVELYKRAIWDFVSPREAAAARADMESLLSNPSKQTVLSEIELLAKDGRRIPVEINSSILSKTPEGFEILAICRDVSKRKELDKMRHDFVVMASHELKTPMVAILGSADFLVQHFKEEMSDRAFQLVQLIHRGSHRMRNLITELIDVSRIETDKFQLHFDTHDLVKIATESIQNLGYLLSECNHKMKTTFPPQLMVRVDAQRIDQVFTNLISNAVKNSPHGSLSEVMIEVVSDVVQISVLDHGVGLTAQEIAKLFEKFSKIDRHDIDSNINIQGSGLGLYISRQIVESHGGTIWAESPGRGKGSTFHFTLPLR